MRSLTRNVLVLSAAALLSLPPMGVDAQDRDAEGLEVFGEADYGWKLETLDGEALTLEAYADRVVFINMWATWCGPCVRELPTIEALKESLTDSDVEFLLVSPEEAAPVEAFLRRYGFDLPVLLEAQDMPEGFGLRALPTTFVVDRQGRIVLRHQGIADWDSDEVRAFLRYLDGVSLGDTP